MPKVDLEVRLPVASAAGRIDIKASERVVITHECCLPVASRASAERLGYERLADNLARRRLREGGEEAGVPMVLALASMEFVDGVFADT